MLNEEPVDLQFNHSGYLFLASEEVAHIMEENYRTQRCQYSFNQYSSLSFLVYFRAIKEQVKHKRTTLPFKKSYPGMQLSLQNSGTH